MFERQAPHTGPLRGTPAATQLLRRTDVRDRLQSLLGRRDFCLVYRPMQLTDTEVTPSDDRLEHLEAVLDVTFDWGYEQTRQDLRSLYSKAKQSQWNGETDLDWSIDVDFGR